MEEIRVAKLSNDESIKVWSQMPPENVTSFGDEGDLARRLLLNPALFALLGDVTGKRILDAGCGQGYLCRLLAKRGASMTGIEPADIWCAYAVQRERAEPLAIRYIRADLSRWQTEKDIFDVVVSNMVMMDIPG